MWAASGSHDRWCQLGDFWLSAVLLVGFALSAVAQGADTKKTDTEKTDNTVWTSESYKDPERNRNNVPQPKGPLFDNRVSGVVRLASGAAPFPPVEIFVCGQPVGSTDEKGRFSVPGPHKSDSGFSPRCFLSIQHPGTKPLSIALPRTTVRLGVLVLKPLPGFDGLFTSATTREAPKAALRAYQEGVRAETKPKPNLDKAATRYGQAVELYPRFAEAWNALGRVRLGLGNIEDAAPAFETAIAADKDFPPPYRMLLSIRMHRQELRPAAVIAAALLRLTPGDDEARYFHALATFGLERYDEAEASARTLIDRGGGEQFPQAFQILGEIEADRGEIDKAVRDFRSYLELAPDAPSAPEIRERLRDWEDIAAKASDDTRP